MKHIRYFIGIIAGILLLTACSDRNPEAVTDMLDRIGGEGASGLFETRISRSISENGEDTFIIGSRSTEFAFAKASLTAIEPATMKAASLESTSW